MHGQRLHFIGQASRYLKGDFVLYWTQTTLRAHDNFALNYAVEQANALGLPVLVYHGLRHDYPHASDRIHAFIIESALDLHRAFEQRGIQYVFYLDTRSVAGGGSESSHASPLVRLARRAALVVTDFFPTFIIPDQTAGLARRTDAPVTAVDSLGVVPLAAFDQAFSSARAIRPRLHALLPHHLHPVGDVEPRTRRRVDPGFDALDLRAIGKGDPAIGRLLQSCAIDHAVAPSPSFRGGMAEARLRLERFLERGLPKYAEGRGDPNQPEATSRLSPYLHFGNISIQEVLLRAREAGPSAQYEKFQDQALVWRELASNFAWRDSRHRSASAVPGWARKELDDHSADPRPAVYTRAELERAATEDELWNYAQRSYLREGYMHNYLRMLWGKTVMQWTRGWRHAFRVLRELNDKYALDGRDPNSYAGVHWCFGRFDRPFYRRPVYGTVRSMSTRAAAGKFDIEKLLAGNTGNRE